jgi:UDP-glucuronate decarboxylase
VEFSIAELAGKVIEIVGSRSEIIHKPLPQDDPTQRCPDISRAQSVLGWRPETALETGLARTVQYFESLLRELETA